MISVGPDAVTARDSRTDQREGRSRNRLNIRLMDRMSHLLSA
jgi:hypothetical protein